VTPPTVAAVHISAGRVVEWRGAPVETGIFKEPVAGRVRVRTLGLDGDRQCDPTVHGGPWKAVYGYAASHYPWWAGQLGRDLASGMFGENLTLEGFDESATHVGDVFRIGEVLLQAVQPRQPCFKLGIRFDDPLMVRRFVEAGRFGVYFRVLEEGTLAVGDAVTPVSRDPRAVPIPALVSLLDAEERDPALVARALECDALPPTWRSKLLGLAEASA